MTPFYIYFPLAIAGFAVIDKRFGKRIKWVQNVLLATLLWLIAFALSYES
jgi:hypothetical protein